MNIEALAPAPGSAHVMLAKALRRQVVPGEVVEVDTWPPREVVPIEWKPLVNHVLDLFGAEVEVVEFDWPGTLLHVSHPFEIGAQFVIPRTGQHGTVLSSRPGRMRVALA